MAEPYERRRAALETALADGRAAGARHADHAPTRAWPARWFEIFEGAGLDGLIAKPADIAYVPGKRADVQDQACPYGRRAWSPGSGTTSPGRWSARCCSGSSTTRARCTTSGVSASFTAARRKELLDELAPVPRERGRGPPVAGAGSRA